MLPDDGRSISRNVAHLNILVHDMIKLLYYNITYLGDPKTSCKLCKNIRQVEKISQVGFKKSSNSPLYSETKKVKFLEWKHR